MKLVKVNLVLLVLIMTLTIPWRTEAEPELLSCVSVSGGCVMQSSSFRIVGAAGRPVIGVMSGLSTIVHMGFRHSGSVISNEENGFSVALAPSIASVDGNANPNAGQNYPNPFNPETWIPYQLATDTNVIFTIYNANGRVIRTLNLGHQKAGAHISKDRAAYWDGKDEAGEPVASGIYFYTIQAGELFTATRKMVVLR